MGKATQLDHNPGSPEKRMGGIMPAEYAIALAAALEMFLLVGGLLWAVNTPPGTALWPRILLVSAIAVIAAVIAIFACAPLLKAAESESGDSGMEAVEGPRPDSNQ